MRRTTFWRAGELTGAIPILTKLPCRHACGSAGPRSIFAVPKVSHFQLQLVRAVVLTLQIIGWGCGHNVVRESALVD
jgi:hypothetical protein